MFSDLRNQPSSELMKSQISSGIKPSPTGATILGVPIQTIGKDMLKTNENVYDLTPELQKALSSNVYTGTIMKNNSDVLICNRI